MSHSGRPNQARTCSKCRTSEAIVPSDRPAAARASTKPASTSVSSAARSSAVTGARATRRSRTAARLTRAPRLHSTRKTNHPDDIPSGIPSSLQIAELAQIDQEGAGPGSTEAREGSGNSGVIFYKPSARSTSPGASLPGQPVPERAHRNRCQLTPPRQFTKPQPNQRKPSQHQPATGSLISPLPLSGLLGPPPQKCLQAGLPRIGLQFLQ